jgi:homoprotocatechuate degradation regulator HpaR
MSLATTFTHRNLPRLLLQARESVMAHTRPSLREHGLSDQQWRVLRVLGEHGTVETGRVAREAYILGPSLTGVLAREAVMQHTRPSLREHGLSDQQWRVLRVLGEHGTVETGRVAREAYILGPSLTGVLARMERDGLVRRERDGADQRRTVVEATAKGRKLVDKLSTTIEEHYQWLEKSLGKPKLAELYELLDQLIELEGP